jgi:hypothetical protein
MAAVVAATLLLCVGGCTSKQPERSDADFFRTPASASSTPAALPDLLPIPSGHMCRGADLYRKAPMSPGGWEKVTDGSAAKYCRLEEVCKLGACPDRMSPSDR